MPKLDGVCFSSVIKTNAPEPRTIDPNAIQEAAERVAQWHIDNCTPEFVEWLDDMMKARNLTCWHRAPEGSLRHRVADAMSIVVINALEMVQDQHQQRQWWFGALVMSEFGFRLPVKMPPVGNSREIILHRQPSDI